MTTIEHTLGLPSTKFQNICSSSSNCNLCGNKLDYCFHRLESLKMCQNGDY